MKKINKKGFTLIELLAVIVILGILMLTAIPAVTRAISKSRKNTYWQNAKQYLQAAQTDYLAGEYYQATRTVADGKETFSTSDIVCSVPPKEKAYRIRLSQINLDSGAEKKSSFGAQYNTGDCEPSVYVVNAGGDDSVKLEWYFSGTDNSGNGIPSAIKEGQIKFSAVKVGDATTTSCTGPVEAANIIECASK